MVLLLAKRTADTTATAASLETTMAPNYSQPENKQLCGLAGVSASTAAKLVASGHLPVRACLDVGDCFGHGHT